VRQRHGDVAPEQFRPTMARALFNWQVSDLLEHTRRRLRQHGIRTVEDVRRCPEILAAPGPEVADLKAGLEQFLHSRVYRHHRVQRMAVKGQRILRLLFAEFCRAPQLLPERYSRRITAGRPERTVCDYLAGMTDRYAQDEYLRLFQPYASV
jgi:dGTPase